LLIEWFTEDEAWEGNAKRAGVVRPELRTLARSFSAPTVLVVLEKAGGLFRRQNWIWNWSSLLQ